MRSGITYREAETILSKLAPRLRALGDGESLHFNVEEQEAMRVMQLALATAWRTARREARVRPDQPVTFFYRHQWFINELTWGCDDNFWVHPLTDTNEFQEEELDDDGVPTTTDYDDET